MARLTQIDIRDSAKIFAVLYALLAIYPVAQHLMEPYKLVEVPVGFLMGPFRLSLDLRFENTASGINIGFVLMPFLYAISGAITGCVLALIFNLFGRALSVRVKTV